VKRVTHCHHRRTQFLAAALVFAALSGCTNTERFGGAQPEQTAAPAPPPAPPPPAPPPVDLTGRWKFSAGSGGCLMTLTATPGATAGSIAPAGGCPNNFFTSRKWTFEHDMLIVRDHKGEPLVELSFANGRFDGKTANGGTVWLARP